MVTLAAAAVVEDRLASMLVADRREAPGNLVYCGVPADLFEGAVFLASERRRDPIGSVLVVVEPMRLLACVSLR